MKVTVDSKKGLKTDLKVIIDKKKIKDQMDGRFEELKKTINLKGFRPGKVPVEILRKQFGKAVYGEVLDKVLKETSSKALEENKIILDVLNPKTYQPKKLNSECMLN